MSLTNINSNDLVTAEVQGVDEKYIKQFEVWLDYLSVADVVKTVFPKIPPSNCIL